MKLAIKKSYSEFHEQRRLQLLEKIQKEYEKRVIRGLNPSGHSYYDTMLDVYQKDKSVKDDHVFEAGWNAAIKYLKK